MMISSGYTTMKLFSIGNVDILSKTEAETITGEQFPGIRSNASIAILDGKRFFARRHGKWHEM